MVHVEICARKNIPVYCNKATSIGMENDAVAGVKQQAKHRVKLVKT